MAMRTCTVWLAAVTVVYGASPLGTITKNMPRLQAQIEKLEPCPEPKSSPIEFKNLMISKSGFNKYELSGKINIKEKFDKPITIVMEMYRCKSKEDPSSCEYYFTFKKANICDLLKRNENSFDYFTNGTDLPTTCPFRPKEYTIDGSTVDLQKINFVPFFQSYWRLKNKAYMKEKLMFCLVSEFALQMVKP
ncbi:uncharacterized protein LOC128989172 [Macrosteles quadrilineatus]|uniref:uncharacterized protein LOC128989172 n=1 Tax=Macrosteles quadrilineatus TaxID=74068 RepID=UPI0023E0C952|nr:uncharacterized protein LOC128989172 [Macrosteles quadrilineatus]